MLFASEIEVTRRFKKPPSLTSCSQFNVRDYKAIDITHLAKGIPESDGFSWIGISKATPSFSSLSANISSAWSWQWLNKENENSSSGSTNVWLIGCSKHVGVEDKLNRASKSVVESGLLTRSPLHIMSLTMAGDLARGPHSSRANSNGTSSTSSSSSEISLTSPQGPEAACQRISFVTSWQLLQNSTGEVGGVGNENAGHKPCEAGNSNLSLKEARGEEDGEGSRWEERFIILSLGLRCIRICSSGCMVCCKWMKI